ncbi:MAG: hypothetical protein V1926_04230 [Candidatus Peregrinibacteria bacterium]
MSELHPHWHSTDDAAAHVPIAPVKEENDVPLAKSSFTVSRRPAAVAGIVIALLLGMVFFRGVTNLKGQATPNRIDVEITVQGNFNPSQVTVRPGDIIRWTNHSLIPHILKSASLCSSPTDCLQTESIFPNATAEFAIAPTVPDGPYPYTSLTSAVLSGIITVSNDPKSQTTAGTPLALSSSGATGLGAEDDLTTDETDETDEILEEDLSEDDLLDEDFPEDDLLDEDMEDDTAFLDEEDASLDDELSDEGEPVDDPPAPVHPASALPAPTQPAVGAPVSSSSSPVSTPQSSAAAALSPAVPEPVTREAPATVVGNLGGIPTNPNTVAAQRGAIGTSQASGQSSAAALHAGAPQAPITGYKPFKQPQTGPGMWVIVVIGTVTLAGMIRRMQRG